MKVGVLTVSDAVSRGEREDISGRLIEEWAAEAGWEVSVRAVVPDETTALVAALSGWADGGLCDLLLTTGGTGLTQRDVTPEATRAVLEREAPGIDEALRADGLRSTPFAALGRGVSGVRGRTLIVNLPGSPKAVADGLAVLSRIAEHAAELLRGDGVRHE